jgi:penicillin-insensitive murein endopeptidase
VKKKWWPDKRLAPSEMAGILDSSMPKTRAGKRKAEGRRSTRDRASRVPSWFASGLGGVTLSLSLGALGSGCVHRGFFTDGSTVAMGRADRGVLRGGRAIPPAGKGFVTPPVWVERGNRYGTDELVALIERAAARVADVHPGGILGVGDLSRRGGGSMQFHKSHENGRDADLIFYAVDPVSTVPLPPADAMPRYNRHLESRAPYEQPVEAVSPRIFDLARNWALVAALVSDAETEVEYLFISERLKEKLLAYAHESGAPADVITRAQWALRQPRHALPHDDHLHLRIRCAPNDRAQGCVDEGPVHIRAETYHAPKPKTRARGNV